MRSDSSHSDAAEAPRKEASQGNQAKPSSGLGCAFKGLACLGVVGLGLFLLQTYLQPEVDAEKTKPVSVSSNSGQGKKGKSSSDSNDSKNLVAGLPDGAITARVNQEIIDSAEHPFDPLLEIANLSLAEIDKNIQDYTATLVSQVLVEGKLQPEKFVFCKIRHARTIGKGNDANEIPFSVYTRFLKPKSSVGLEAIWVDGWHEGNLVAHATGLLNVKKFYLDPDGRQAMSGNRHAIREIGFRNLIAKMAELAVKDRKHGECKVNIKRNVEVNGSACTVFEVIHPVARDHFENHIARIYIDDSRNIPIAYEAYLWPEKEGDEPPLLEKYYYTDLKINVGLTHDDFQADNKEYNFPSW
ncbi:MAG: DUF1571 domain-containing protein [Mariniblastus sp.]